MKSSDDSYALRQTINHISAHNVGGPNEYQNGTVLTASGIVECYSESEYTRLDFVFAGRHYMRVIRRRFSKVSLARMANKFAKEIAG